MKLLNSLVSCSWFARSLTVDNPDAGFDEDLTGAPVHMPLNKIGEFCWWD
jgi:hypothetical protein